MAIAITSGILAQLLAPPLTGETLYTIPTGKLCKASLFVANQTDVDDAISVAIVKNGNSLNDECYLTCGGPLYARGTASFDDLNLNAGDLIAVQSHRGSTSFNLTGILYSVS